ncbi:LLM class flavin-dependent oxidoreductase [Streptomyces mirabilis]|uniref:LLM class flavin-dependent oxidoreductase n=1 Tax=Streptomyces mirabilis TaxID=68239 RepID=UPI0036DCA77C
MTLRLSILDQSPIPAGGAPAEALIATLQLARSAEGLASLLENTRRLRIGSGGVFLPRYEPRKVAEVFRVLGALHPGRVDLGIGRAGGVARDFPRRFAKSSISSASPTRVTSRRPSGFLVSAADPPGSPAPSEPATPSLTS